MTSKGNMIDVRGGSAMYAPWASKYKKGLKETDNARTCVKAAASWVQKAEPAIAGMKVDSEYAALHRITTRALDTLDRWSAKMQELVEIEDRKEQEALGHLAAMVSKNSQLALTPYAPRWKSHSTSRSSQWQTACAGTAQPWSPRDSRRCRGR